MIAWVDQTADLTTTVNTLFTHDARNNLATEAEYTSYAANGTPLPADGYTLTHYVYDQAGQLLSRYADGKAVESFAYDGLAG